ncbi:serine/threonine-protein kinase [Actinoplanes subtropicus]|uniref:serine/threonine-protein kinase n=1 Tax=Actinoplanes subtropicus TaxID=543632 RepID=UPI00068E7300|nr:serine/threonine-protein kinase [Actinoplanes subtropicus]
MHTERLGSRYTLSDRLGQGSMGEVHLARTDEEGGRPVAVKLLRPELAEDLDLVSRFLQEARLLRTVEHPNVVRVLDLVAEGDRLAIVMEYVSGGDLRRAISRPCPAPLARDILVQIAEGLAAIHAAGIVHRDLKPENVLIERGSDDSYRARVTDFGVAQHAGTGSSGRQDLVGTAAYLSPECVHGRPVGPESDVYALGVMAHELITGGRPVTAKPVERPAAMTGPWWELVSRMLAKEPDRRPRAAEVARTLRGLPGAPQGVAPPAELAANPAAETATLLRGSVELAVLRADRGCDTMLPAPKTPAGRLRRLPRGPLITATAAAVVVLVAAVGMHLAPASTAMPTPSATPAGPRSAPSGATPAPAVPRAVPSTSTSTTAATPSAPAVAHPDIRAPQVPVLVADVAGDTALASDSQASLRIDGVVAGSGRVAKILVNYDDGSRQVQPTAKFTGPYRTTITGLVNGRKYAFSVRVCNSFGKCNTSRTLAFTPFGLPRLNDLDIEAEGLQHTLVIPPVDLNGNPQSWTCTVTALANLPDRNAPTDQAVSTGGGQITWFAPLFHRYTARQTCTNGTATLTGPALSFQT